MEGHNLFLKEFNTQKEVLHFQNVYTWEKSMKMEWWIWWEVFELREEELDLESMMQLEYAAEPMQRENVGNAFQIQITECLYQGWGTYIYGRTNFAKDESCILNTICFPFKLYQMLKEIIVQMIFDFKGSDKKLGTK